MTALQPQFLEVGKGAARRRIAVLSTPGRAPGLVWLPGFKSDMASTKATALDGWARKQGLALTRFDYSGHGQSEGRFEDGTIGRWLEEAVAVITRLTRGEQVLIGSSMGGYIALLALRRLLAEAPAEAARIRALLLIAPAWDMTEELMWKQFPDDARRAVMEEGVWYRPSAYGEPYAITRGLIEEGRNHLLARQPWDPGRPVVIMHGALDQDVPLKHSHELERFLQGGRTRLVTVPDGEHRLSRPEDLELLFRLLGELVANH
ncbi:MAG TPA: alpha/beta hydrolase [Hyphomicrobiaceae bacterium]|nr:alpha/beta hydrolase [Hyphomicrobiaceae bacterium]